MMGQHNLQNNMLTGSKLPFIYDEKIYYAGTQKGHIASFGCGKVLGALY